MGKQLKPEAQIRLEHYNEALLRKDDSVEHKLATYMDAFLQGYNGEPHPPFRPIGGEDLTDILEYNDTYDTLEDALYDYCRAHEEMDAGDYAKLAKAADSVAYYEYQNYKEPEELVASYIQHLQKERPNADTLKGDIIRNIQNILKVNRQVGVSEKTIDKALDKVRKELPSLMQEKHQGR